MCRATGRTNQWTAHARPPPIHLDCDEMRPAAAAAARRCAAKRKSDDVSNTRQQHQQQQQLLQQQCLRNASLSAPDAR